MLNIFKSIKTSHTIAIGGASYLTDYLVYLQVKDREAITKLQERLISSEEKVCNLQRELGNLEVANEQLIRKNESLIQFYREEICKTSKLIEQTKVQLPELNNLGLKAKDQYTECLEKLHDQIDIANKIADKALDLWRAHYPKLWDGDSLISIFGNFKEIISQLTFEQLWAISHIFSSIFILILIINIIIIIYSDFLLTYLKIEDKYPRLGRLIRLRRVYQQYYLVLNLLFIIITILATIFINYSILATSF